MRKEFRRGTTTDSLLADRLFRRHFPHFRRRRAVPAPASGSAAQRRGFAGDVYINPRGDDFLTKLAPWRDVAKAGHEIGNHSIAHVCSRGFHREPTARGLENMTLDDVEKDIAEAKRRLQQLVPQQAEMSFAYPCYMDHVGSGPTRQSYVPVVAKHHIAGRGKGEFPLPTTRPPLTCTTHGRGQRADAGMRDDRVGGDVRPQQAGASSRFTASGRGV